MLPVMKGSALTNRTTILICDDHRIVRQGLRALLESQPDFTVVGEAENGREALQQAKSLRPDIILMDISMPLLNGLETARQLTREGIPGRVIALSVHDDEDMIRMMLAAGAMGYFTKDTASEELISAIRTVTRGEIALSPAITRLVVEDYLRWADVNERQPDNLTPREREVLQLIAEGHRNTAIAKVLNISVKTVSSHRTNLMQKLNLHSHADLIQYAIHKKIIEI
jgi:DNA-binding NarL/FixJ family response regulator